MTLDTKATDHIVTRHENPIAHHRATNLVWVDLETTGFNPMNGVILEVGCVVTDKDLRPIAGQSYPIRRLPAGIQHLMDQKVWDMHTTSGLLEECAVSPWNLDTALGRIREMILAWVDPGASPICGNTIGFDRNWLQIHASDFLKVLHYRNLDVSTVKNLARVWYGLEPPFPTEPRHRVRDDLAASIGELEWYKRMVFRHPEDNRARVETYGVSPFPRVEIPWD